jgi:hypothetical protein
MVAWTISARKTQEFLIGSFFFSLFSFVNLTSPLPFSGKPFSYETLERALSILCDEIDLPFDVPGGMPSFRKTLALSFLFKFWNAVSVQQDIPLDAAVTKTASSDDSWARFIANQLQVVGIIR